MISLDVFEKQCNSYNQQLNGMVISKYSSSKISTPHLKSLCATTLLQEFFNHLTMDHLKYSREMTKHSSSKSMEDLLISPLIGLNQRTYLKMNLLKKSHKNNN